jgi:hypothetical protein
MVLSSNCHSSQAEMARCCQMLDLECLVLAKIWGPTHSMRKECKRFKEPKIFRQLLGVGKVFYGNFSIFTVNRVLDPYSWVPRHSFLVVGKSKFSQTSEFSQFRHPLHICILLSFIVQNTMHPIRGYIYYIFKT